MAGATLEQENRRLRRQVATLRQEQAFVKNASVDSMGQCITFFRTHSWRCRVANSGCLGLPSEKRQRVWEMWRAGQSISKIASWVGSPAGSIFSILLPFGGIRHPSLVAQIV